MTAGDPNDARRNSSGVARSVESKLSAGGGLLALITAFATRTDEPISLSKDELYECLSASRRRKLIRFLAGVYDPDGDAYIEVKSIAEAFAESQHNDPGWQESKRYYISFIQLHLPALDRWGLIEYHERVKKVQPTAAIVPVANTIDAIDRRCEPSSNKESDGKGH